MESKRPETRSRRSLGLLLIVLVSLLLIGFGLPIYQEVSYHFLERSRSRFRITKNNMKQIGLALHNYHETYATLPPGAILSPNGTPSHSWQALILPFLDQQFLFRQIDFEKPWHASANQEAFQQEVPVYLNPKAKSKTSPDGYALSHFVGNKLVLKSGTDISFEEMHDGTSNTIMAMEIGEHFKPWGDPTSLTEPVNVIGPNKKTLTEGGSFILMGDGRVRFINKIIDPVILKALSTPAGGEEVGEF